MTKRKWIVAVILVLIVLLCVLLFPKTRMINVQTTVYEYALNQKEPIAEHEISIGGRFTKRLFREDVLQGHMVISGYPETDGASVTVQFWGGNDHGIISYMQGGVPVWGTELINMYANDDFSQVIIQLFEVTIEEDGTRSSWSGDTGRVLTTAADYDTLMELSAELGMFVETKGE